MKGTIVKLLLNLNEVIVATSISSATIYRRMAVGRFPRPVAVSDRAKRWRAVDIEAFARDPGQWKPGENPTPQKPAGAQ